MVIANHIFNNIDIFFGYGNGSFANQLIYSTGFYPQFVAVGDFNNDTRLDIVVANHQSYDVSVLLGYGNGSFANQMTHSTGSGPSSVAVGDFNNDTRLDIVVANENINNVSVLLGFVICSNSIKFYIMSSIIQLCDLHDETLDLIIREKRVYQGLPSSITEIYHNNYQLPMLDIMKLYHKYDLSNDYVANLKQPDYFILYITSFNVTHMNLT